MDLQRSNTEIGARHDGFDDGYEDEREMNSIETFDTFHPQNICADRGASVRLSHLGNAYIADLSRHTPTMNFKVAVKTSNILEA